MKFFWTIVFLALVMMGNAVIAQDTDANIFGHVIDKQTHEHLPFVNVVIKGTTKGASTDASGHYFITNLAEGNHTVEVSYVGYVTYQTEIFVKRGESKELNIEIEPDTQLLNDVVVSASRVAVSRREAAVVVNVLSPKALDRVKTVKRLRRRSSTWV